jgi:hypothetical protein
VEHEVVALMRRYALILATANYDDPAFRPLPSVHADAWYLPQVLEDPAIGSFEQVTVVKDAPANEMQAALISFLTAREPDELALLYISGHGVWSREVGQLYFVAASSKGGRLWETGLPAESVNEQLEACRARCKVALLDCCFSGSFVQGFRTRGETGPPPEALSTRGVYVITASDTRETAYEGDSFNNGVSAPSVFTGVLLEGLRTGRADLAGDGLVSVDELYQYVHKQVRSKNLPTVQTPTKSAHRVVGDIVLARSPIGSRERPRDLDPPPSTPSGDRLGVSTSVRSDGESDSAPLDASRWRRLLEYWLGGWCETGYRIRAAERVGVLPAAWVRDRGIGQLDGSAALVAEQRGLRVVARPVIRLPSPAMGSSAGRARPAGPG